MAQSAEESHAAIAISSYHFSETGAGTADCDLGNSDIGGSMAINFVRTRHGSDKSIRFQRMEHLKVYLFGATVLFASFGMGEAVYRLLFSEFDGITDRIPVEVLFGLVFAWLATKFVGGVYRNRKERSARLNFIWARNHRAQGDLAGLGFSVLSASLCDSTLRQLLTSAFGFQLAVKWHAKIPTTALL